MDEESTGSTHKLTLEQRRLPKKQHRAAAVRSFIHDPAYDFPIADIVDELVEKYHITRNQARFLMVRLNYSTDSDAARAIGLEPHTPSTWRWNRPETRRKYVPVYFKQAYDELFARSRDAAQRKMRSLAMKVANRTEELLDANKAVKVGDEIVHEPDYDARFKGIQAASRWLGEWGTEPRVEVNTQYNVVMDQFGKLVKKLTDAVVDGEVIEVEEDSGT